jgi:hypothetical protein
MKQAQDEHRFFYVDETGDASFLRQGQKTDCWERRVFPGLRRWFPAYTKPDLIRQRLSALRDQFAADRYLKAVPSMQKTLHAFHAKDDCAEVRKAVFGCLDELDFSVQIVIARKLESVFTSRHNRSQDAFTTT